MSATVVAEPPATTGPGQRRTSWLDAIAPIAMTMLALSALEGSYADRTYLVVGEHG